jgi:hypothetical protein
MYTVTTSTTTTVIDPSIKYFFFNQYRDLYIRKCHRVIFVGIIWLNEEKKQVTDT